MKAVSRQQQKTSVVFTWHIHVLNMVSITVTTYTKTVATTTNRYSGNKNDNK